MLNEIVYQVQDSPIRISIIDLLSLARYISVVKLISRQLVYELFSIIFVLHT